jgi:hypothetical protein
MRMKYFAFSFKPLEIIRVYPIQWTVPKSNYHIIYEKNVVASITFVTVFEFPVFH